MSAPFGGPPDLPFATEGSRRRCPSSPDDPRGAGGAAPAAQALPVVLLDPAGQRRRCGIAGRASTISCAPISITRAPTGRTTGRIGWPLVAPKNWRRCRPTTSWTSPTTCRRRWQGDAVAGGDRRLPMAARRRAGGLCRRVPAHRVSGRAQLVPLAQRRRVRVRIAAVLRAHDRRAVDLHLAARATGASISGRARSSACRTRPAPAWSAATCSTAPGTGCSRSRRPGSASCCWSS